MQNVKKLKEEYKILNEQVQTIGEEIKKLEERKNPLMPERRDGCWCINTTGFKEMFVWNNTKTDNDLLAIGNIYLTEQKINKEIEKRKSIQKIKTYIVMNFPFEPDWNDDEQVKYNIDYDTGDGLLKMSCSCHVKPQTQIGFLKATEDCQIIMDKFEKELRIIFNN